MASKRKRHYYPSGSGRQHPDSRRPSLPHSPKRRRLSNDSRGSGDGMYENERYQPPSRGHDQDSDGWTKVVSKSSKSKNRNKKRGTQDDDDYPRLRLHEKSRPSIRLAELRDLGLYLLADEVAPKWTAIENSRYVKKVVTIMVPGLDENLLWKAKKRLESSQHAVKASDAESSPQDQLSKSTNEPLSNDHRGPMPDATEDTVNNNGNSISIDHLSLLFRDLIDVKAPGDAKANRVHSPLQAMLLSPEQQQQKKNSNAFQDRGFQAAPTPITEFVHDADELREANFPIHPAAFTNKTDAELEAVRREQTGQGKSVGWVDTEISQSVMQCDKTNKDSIAQGTSIYSIDCEMVLTSDDMNSLARVSMIRYPDGKVIIDKYVKPDLPITNYFTQYSGITPEILKNVTTTLADVQKELLAILTPSCILLGHSLDSDLNALKLTHPFLVDTSLIYPHPRGLPLRSSLKYLANKYLKREIQTGGANGHNSVEDAQAVLDLVKLKCEKGPKWGTMEANGEPIFKRLKRSGRTSAMVEYGTPERGFGKDATHTIGCQDDDEVVKGVIRSVKGDGFFDFEIPAGGVEYVWGRLRALEYARGWVAGASTTFQAATADAAGARTNDRDTKEITHGSRKTQHGEEEVDQFVPLACDSLDRIQKIYDALPEKSLLVVFNGTSDVRPVMRLQAQQQQYRKEFKVKKWDELTIKWTDTEEQALRKACDDARAGWGSCTIK